MKHIILIFEPVFTGHHLEYLHHYYLGALERPNNEYIFLVSKSFDKVKDKYEWKTANNIELKYIDEKYNILLTSTNFYKLGWNVSKVLNYYVRKLKPDEVILTTLMQFIPFINFIFPRKVKVRGIMYKIYLYEQDKMTKLRLFLEKARLWLTARSNIVDTVYVLNDSNSALELNRIYHTKKFKYLPDPVPQIDMNTVRDLRSELKIPQNHIIYLHFGGLEERKGTIDILKSIIDLCEEQLKDKTFIFAGKQTHQLKELFYPLLEIAKEKASIIVYDEFCSYEFLYNLCNTCNVILMPYHITNISSGVIGYAALFNKPVIGPSGGLLGRLIRKYELGKTVDIPVNGDYFSFNDCKLMMNNDLYVKNHMLTNFIEIIMKC